MFCASWFTILRGGCEFWGNAFGLWLSGGGWGLRLDLGGFLGFRILVDVQSGVVSNGVYLDGLVQFEAGTEVVQLHDVELKEVLVDVDPRVVEEVHWKGLLE